MRCKFNNFHDYNGRHFNAQYQTRTMPYSTSRYNICNLYNMHVLIGDVAASRCSLFQSGNHPTNWLTCRLAIRPQRVFRSLNRLNHFSWSFLIKLSNVIICILWKLFCKHFHKETTTLYLYSVSYTNKLAYIIKVAANCPFAFYVGPKTFCYRLRNCVVGA